MFDFRIAKMFSAATFEAYAYHKDIWIPVTEYYMYCYQTVLSPLTDRLQLRNFAASRPLVYLLML